MSSTQPERPAEPSPDAVARPDAVAPSAATPDEHLLVDPARVRRAPRYRGFFTVGAIVGVAVGLWLGTFLAGEAIEQEIAMLKPGVFVSVVTLGVTTFFVLLAGALAIWADRRSLKKLR